MDERAVPAWEFDQTCDLAEVVRLAMEHLAPPSFVGRVLSTRGDALTVQVIEGSLSGDPRSLFYVGGHGAFVLARREEWPPPPGGERKRLLLTLLAFPQPVAVARAP